MKLQASWQPLARQARDISLVREDSGTSVKLATFPDAPPLVRTDYQYMDIWEPHSKPPSSAATSAIWGSWEDQTADPPAAEQPVWNMVVTAGTEPLVKEFQKFLENLLMQSPGVPLPPESLNLFSHWTTVIGAIFIQEIHLGRLYVRKVAKKLEHLVTHSWL
jgi:hypothetical protein